MQVRKKYATIDQMSVDTDSLKKEANNLMQIHKNDEDIKGFAKLIETRVSARVKQVLGDELKKINTPQKVKIDGTPEVKVTFPDVQVVKGNVIIKGPIEAKVTFPTIQKVEGTVKAKLDYEKLQEIFEEVLEKFESPELQKISGEVLAKVTFPDIQKIKGEVLTNIPIATGQTPSKHANPTVYVPVRLTNGKQFYEAIAGIAEAGRATASYADKGGVPKTVVIGQQAMKDSIPVVFASDQPPTTISGNILATLNTVSGPIPVVISNASITVIPGNTPNTIPWLTKPHDGANPIYKAAAALADGMTNPTVGGIQNFPMVFNGTSWDRLLNIAQAYGTFGQGIIATGSNVESPIDFKYYNLFGAPPNRDTIDPSEGYAAHQNAFNLVFNGAKWDRLRTPNIFKTATATASGNTAVWVPTSGKKFRLMQFLIDIPANAAISGGGVVVDIAFQDSTTDMGIGFSVFIPTTAITTAEGGFQSGWISLGNGILSAAANNSLNVNLSVALTTSKVRVSVAGTEE